MDFETTESILEICRYFSFIGFPFLYQLVLVIQLAKIFSLKSSPYIHYEQSTRLKIKAFLFFLFSVALVVQIVLITVDIKAQTYLFGLLEISAKLTCLGVIALILRALAKELPGENKKSRSVIRFFILCNIIGVLGDFGCEFVNLGYDLKKMEILGMILGPKLLILLLLSFSNTRENQYDRRGKDLTNPLLFFVAQDDLLTFKILQAVASPELTFHFSVFTMKNKHISSSKITLFEVNKLFKHLLDKYCFGNSSTAIFRVSDFDVVQNVESRMNIILQNKGFYDTVLMKALAITDPRIVKVLTNNSTNSSESYTKICREVPSLFNQISWRKKEEVYGRYLVQLKANKSQVNFTFEDKKEKTKNCFSKSLNELMRFMGSLPYFIGNWDLIKGDQIVSFFEEKLNMMLNEQTYSLELLSHFLNFVPKQLPHLPNLNISLKPPKNPTIVANWKKAEIHFSIDSKTISFDNIVTRSKEQILIFLEHSKLKRTNMKLNSLSPTQIFTESMVSYSSVVDLIHNELKTLPISDSTEARLFFEIDDVMLQMAMEASQSNMSISSLNND